MLHTFFFVENFEAFNHSAVQNRCWMSDRILFIQIHVQTWNSRNEQLQY